jgi:hypothetical protein
MGRFDTYSGMVTAFPYAFRQSDSRLFRSYVVVSTLVGALVALLMANALVVLVGNTASAPGGSLTLSRTFYVVVGLFVFLPVVAPVLFVAHRYRRERDVADRYDAALAASGYLFVGSVYVALVISTPAAYREAGAGPVVDALYSLPALAGVVPPLVAAAAVYLVHRHYGSKHGNGEPA